MADISSTAVLIGPALTQIVIPFAFAVAVFLFKQGVDALVVYLRDKRKIAIDQSLVDGFEAEVSKQANIAVLAADSSFATASIKVGSPMVAQATTDLLNQLTPDQIKSWGVTSDGVARSIAAALGEAQIRMTRNTAPAHAPAAPAAVQPSV